MKNSINSDHAGLAWLSVVQTYQLCQQRYEELLAGFDLSLAQFDALNTIDRLGNEALPKNIADSLVVTRGNVSGLLKRLAAADLIRQQAHPEDGRALIVQLTDKAQVSLKQAQSAARRFVTAQLEPFSTAELESTRTLMQSMHAHLRSLDIEAIAAASTHQPGNRKNVE